MSTLGMAFSCLLLQDAAQEMAQSNQNCSPQRDVWPPRG